ncbi:unnamed protein product [Calicophoron daubneyi]|uniref:Serine/threonine-protein phosphatase n=1 Tax=Calicophoron daubneyi TaxID=300641 RepID=A0AAV2TPQ8_CALDB
MAMHQSYLVRKKRSAILANIDSLVRRLTQPNVKKGGHANLTEKEMLEVTAQVADTFLDETSCIDLDMHAPLCIVGDIYGQYGDLITIFEHFGYPPNQRYLFLGNYCDRGRQSVELICLLFSFKLKFPEHIFMLRGNHECEFVTCHYGFLRECTQRYSQKLWRAVMNAFNCLPAAAIIEDCIFCVHSGMIPCVEYSAITDKERLRLYIADRIRRPVSLTRSDLLVQLTWSEPVADTMTWRPNPVGLGRCFGENVVKQFCERLGFSLIVRSNELLERGYEFSADGQLLTVFTASHFTGGFRNLGAFIYLESDSASRTIKGQIKLLKPSPKLTKELTPYSTYVILDSAGTEKTPRSSWLCQSGLPDVFRTNRITGNLKANLAKT